MKINLEERKIPHFGQSLLLTAICESCGYKHSDVWDVDEQVPVKLTFESSTEKDLTVKVVKSSNATVKIPQLGLEVTPGSQSQGYIANVEGVLERIQDALLGIEQMKPEKKQKIKELLEKIAKMRNAKEMFTLIIEDPSGNSKIISDKAKKEKLKKQ